MSKLIEIPVEPLTEGSFAPFGAIVGALAAPPALRLDTMATWKAPFAVDGAMEMTVCRYFSQPMRLTVLERHLAVTQAFLPLGGTACVMVVAPPTDLAKPDDAPPPGSLRAFRMEGGAGVVLHRGTWHALRRYPLDADHVDVVLLTGADTQAEIEAQARTGAKPKLTHEVDYATQGIEFAVRL